MNNNITLRHRTVKRDGYNWTIEIILNKRHTPVNKTAIVKRNGETWGCVQKLHSGKVNIIPLWPAKEFPSEVLADVNADLA